MRDSRYPDASGWTVLGGYPEGASVPGLPIEFWHLPWRRTVKILLTEPLHGTQRSLDVVHVDTESDGTVKFAVDEVSNGIYLFALPD